MYPDPHDPRGVARLTLDHGRTCRKTPDIHEKPLVPVPSPCIACFSTSTHCEPGQPWPAMRSNPANFYSTVLQHSLPIICPASPLSSFFHVGSRLRRVAASSVSGRSETRTRARLAADVCMWLPACFLHALTCRWELPKWVFRFEVCNIGTDSHFCCGSLSIPLVHPSASVVDIDQT